jgi:hypothetical protein
MAAKAKSDYIGLSAFILILLVTIWPITIFNVKYWSDITNAPISGGSITIAGQSIPVGLNYLNTKVVTNADGSVDDLMPAQAQGLIISILFFFVTVHILLIAYMAVARSNRSVGEKHKILTALSTIIIIFLVLVVFLNIGFASCMNKHVLCIYLGSPAASCSMTAAATTPTTQ